RERVDHASIHAIKRYSGAEERARAEREVRRDEVGASDRLERGRIRRSRGQGTKEARRARESSRRHGLAERSKLGARASERRSPLEDELDIASRLERLRLVDAKAAVVPRGDGFADLAERLLRTVRQEVRDRADTLSRHPQLDLLDARIQRAEGVRRRDRS